MVTSEVGLCVKQLDTSYHILINIHKKMSKFRVKKIIPYFIHEPVHSLIHRRTIRVPKYWRLQKNLSGNTIDPDFEELVEELDAIDDACHEMIDIHRVYCLIIMELIASSQRVVNSFHILSRPGAQLAEDEIEYDEAWQIAKSYQCALEEINLVTKDSLISMSSELDVKVHALIDLLSQVHRHINKRDSLLARYEKLLDKLDSMTIIGATTVLSQKQKTEYAALKQLLETAKGEYSNCNAMICMELPYFFALVRKFMEPALELLLLIHLSVAYQTHQNFLSLEEDLGISGLIEKSCFIGDYAEQFQIPDPTKVEALGIVRADENYLKPLTEIPTQDQKDVEIINNNQYCRALYSYNSDVEEDLIFSQGDIIEILRKSGNWWEGKVNGRKGIFPINYVEPFDEAEAASEPNVEEMGLIVTDFA